MKKIGITGANGHVGANLVRRLLKEEYEIRVMQYHDHEAFDGLPVEVVKGDLNNVASLEAFCKQLDVVIHLAAKISIGSNSYERLTHVNIEGTKNLVAEAKKSGVKRFIHFSSIHSLSHHPLDVEMDESRSLSTASPIAYEKTKSIADEWVMKQHADNFDVIVINPTAIVGPYDYKPSLIGSLIIQLYKGIMPALIPGGYDFVDVRDVCDAVCNAVYQGRGGERYILSGTWKSLSDFAKLLGAVTDKKIEKVIMPLWVARIGLPFIYMHSKLTGQQPLYTSQSLTILQEGNKNICHDKAKKELGFVARPLAESLKDTFNWLKENNYLKV